MVEWKISNHVRLCQNNIIRVCIITYIWVSKAVSNKQERITLHKWKDNSNARKYVKEKTRVKVQTDIVVKSVKATTGSNNSDKRNNKNEE